MDKQSFRYYQLEYIDGLTRAYISGKKGFLAEMATGTGKISATIYALAELVRAGKVHSGLILVHRTESAHQILHRLQDFNELISSRLNKDLSLTEPLGVVVSTIQAFYNNYPDFPSNAFDIVAAVDCPLTPTLRKTIDRFEGFKLVVTSPLAGSRSSLVDFRYTLNEAIRDGFVEPLGKPNGARQALLGMTPGENQVGLGMVITTEPYSWVQGRADAPVVDVSRLFQPDSSISRCSLAKRFSDSGWSDGALVTIGAEANRRFAVLGSSFQVVLVLEEFSEEDDWSEAAADARLYGILETGITPFACVTDGSTFYLGRRGSLETHKLSQAPRMEDLVGLGHFTPSLYVVSSGKELETVAERLSPQMIILDVATPKVGHYDSGALLSLLPEATRQKVNSTPHPIMVLLAWAAALSSTEVVAASLSVSLAVSPKQQEMRTLVTTSLPIFSVFELSADAAGEPRNESELLVHFGGNRKHTCFHLLTLRGDLNGYESRPWFGSVSRWFQGNPPTVGFTSLRSHVSVWRYTNNSPELNEIKERLSRLGNLVPLGEICTIKQGIQTTLATEEQDDRELVAHVQLNTLDEDTVDLGKARKLRVEGNVPEDAFLQPGDILLPKVVHEGANAVVYRASNKALPGHSILVIRRKAYDISPDYLCEFLNSPAARFMLVHFSSKLGNRSMLQIDSLEGLPVPVVSPELRGGLQQTYEVEQSLLRKADELRAGRRALFESQSPQQLQENLGSLKRMGKVLAASVQRSERFEFRVSNFYPFPLAFGFRFLDGLVSPVERYREQLRIAENLLAFIGSISLSLLDSEELKAASGLDLKQMWQGGISPGHWREIVIGCGRALRTRGSHPLVSAILGLRIGSQEKGFGRSVDTVIRSLNDFKHNRGPTAEEDILIASRAVGEALHRCMESLEFFTDYPIRMVADLDAGRRGGVTLSCLRYVGDHPGLEQEEVQYHQPLKKGDLFLELSQADWLPLYPFISTWNCASCHVRETFFIDWWSREDGRVRIKSFERGHSRDVTQLTDALRAWHA